MLILYNTNNVYINIKQALEAAPHKAAVVWPLTTHHEVGTNSYVTYSCGLLHMDEQRQDNQLEPTYSSSGPIQDVALKTCWKQLTIEKSGEKGSGISVLMTRHDDDDDDTQLYNFKYSYLILIIHMQLYGFMYSYLILIMYTQ